MELDEVLETVRHRAGSTEKDALRASKQTLEVLGALLTRADREALADQLPRSLANALRRRDPGEDFGLDQFYEEVLVDEEGKKGFQIEHAQAVCAALAELVDGETNKRLKAHLPEEFQELLEPREIPEIREKPRGHDIDKNGRKLSTGRPGSSRPLAEARGGGHAESLASRENPHAGRKLSSGAVSPNDGSDFSGRE